jgi:hypothetical protein
MAIFMYAVYCIPLKISASHISLIIVLVDLFNSLCGYISVILNLIMAVSASNSNVSNLKLYSCTIR